jgi:hypothetical protein
MISFRLLSAVMICFLTSSTLQGAVITFTYSESDNGKTVISKTVSGVTLTLSNPQGGTFIVDSDGIGVGLAAAFLPADITSFDLAITGGVGLLTGYSLGYANSAASQAFFSMSGGSNFSPGNPLSSTGAHTANGNWTLAPGQSGTLSASGFASNGLAQFKSLTFDVTPATAVPEPSTLGAFLVGLGAVVARRRRVRAAQAEPVT